jgi:DNA-binding response OmpR family regulator
MAIVMNATTALPEQTDIAGVIILCAEEVLRDAIAYWCSALPVRAQVAEDGYHANRLLRAGPWGLLVTDRVLPPWPGLDTFRALRARMPGLRIAFVDGGSRDDLSLARVTGVTDILPRPLTRLAVADAVGRLARAS